MERKTLTTLFPALAVVLLLLVIGCEFEEPSRVAEGIRAETSALNVPLLRVEYDEKATTYALHWPGNMVYDAGLGKAMADGDALYLLDFQNVRKTMEVDADGFFSFSGHHIEGNEDIRMPAAIWEGTLDTRPYQDSQANSVNRTLTANGSMIRFGENGEVITTLNYNPEEFWIDPDLFEMLLLSQECDTCTMGKREMILSSLENGNAAYQVTDDAAVVEKQLNVEGLSHIKQVIDLKSGKVVKSAVYRNDGRFHSVKVIEHTRVNGYQIMNHEITYHFGDVNSNWQAKTVSRIDRTNFHVEMRQHND